MHINTQQRDYSLNNVSMVKIIKTQLLYQRSGKLKLKRSNEKKKEFENKTHAQTHIHKQKVLPVGLIHFLRLKKILNQEFLLK